MPAHTLARDWLQKARRQASQDIQEGSIDDFMNRMGLGDPDPSNHRTGFDGADEIVDWFREINQMIGGSVTEKITPETYEKMNEEFEEEVLPSESLFLRKKKLMSGKK